MTISKFSIALLCFFSISSLKAQTALDQYIDQALESNIALQQKGLSYQKSLAALEEAKALFFPKLSLEARYSVAGGGRTIELPLGDLLNPVYSNLNLINDPASGIPIYPQIDNEEFQFFRPREHETKLRLVYPIFNAAIRNNHKIQQHLSHAEQIAVEIYKRELVKEVKTAYFNYQKAYQAQQLFDNTLKLVQENLRTTKSLHQYDKLTIDVVYAAEVEVKRVEQQLAIARKDQEVARAYFNFLLNRSYEEIIEADSALANQTQAPIETPASAEQLALQKREELRQLDSYISAAKDKTQLNKGELLPQVNLVADYGFQGQDYGFGKEDDFIMGSLVLSWPLFNKPTKAKVQQAQIEQQILSKRKEEVSRQIGLQLISTRYELEAAEASIKLGISEVASAKKAYRLVEKKFRQGQANLIELTDARTRKTNAELRLIIFKFDYHLKSAAYERAIGGYEF